MTNFTNTTGNFTSDPQGTAEGTRHMSLHEDSAVILFLFGSCAVGALTRRIIQGLNLRLPYTVVLLVVGILFGLLSFKYPEVHTYAHIVEADPHLILTVFLPVLLFESAFAMEVHTFIKTSIQVVLLAIPGLALTSFLTCILARYLFTYDWDWNQGMMFGAILSATDPVAVVALLRDLGASKQLAMVIEGEALLNDGAAIVFFNVFLKLTTTEVGLSGGEIVVYFIQVAIGGPVVGFVFAKITLFCLSRIFNDSLAEITITLASTYITYYVVEVFFNMSGVLAVVVLGIVMSSERTMISPEVERFLHKFWETLAYLANTLIFIIVGMVISEKAIFEIHGIDWFYMFSLYFGIFVIRGMVIALFSPVLRQTGYGLSWQEGIVMTWGGLRGAVGLMLALQVAHHDRIDQESIGVRICIHLGFSLLCILLFCILFGLIVPCLTHPGHFIPMYKMIKVLMHVSGVVFLTLLVNATTIHGLLQILGMSELSPAKRMAMASSMRHLQEMREKTLNMLKTDRFLADAEWETVERQTEVNDPYKTTEEEAQLDESLEFKQNTHCPECHAVLPPHYSRKELRDMSNEAIMRLLKAEKMSYWRQFEQGMLSREATGKLQECTEVAADTKGKCIDVEEIKKSWEMPSFYGKLKSLVKRSIEKTVVDNIERDSRRWYLFKFTRHPAFYITVYCLIVLDMVNVGFAIASEFVTNFFADKNIFRWINVGFVIIYIIEATLKLIVQRKHYFKNTWHILCLVIIGVGLIDIIQNFALPSIIGENIREVFLTATVFILLRTIRVFRLLEPTMPYVLLYIRRKMNAHLSYGFDVGRGYVAGEEEVKKLIDHMVDHKDIAKSLKQISDNGRLDVIRCLGMLTKQYPEIALSIKTRQASRSVLNQLRDGVQELTMDGIIEETEGHKIEKNIEEKMKRLQGCPPSLPIPPADKMLNNVSWLRNHPELIEYIKEKAKLLNFGYDDVVMHEGDPPGGIYIIVSGMVRIELRCTHPDQCINEQEHLESINIQGKPIVALQEKASGIHMHGKNHVLDFMTSGNIIGEMGLLTHKPRSATVVCETSVQMLFISLEDMEHAIIKFRDEDESLEYRLWHVCANRIAANILMKQATYQGWTKEKIKLRLENSYIADASETFCVDSSMSDVILVNGTAKNPFTDEQFEGPCYIPWTVFKLQIMPVESSQPVIVLVIPTEIGQPSHSHSKKTSEQQRGHGAFINSISQLCLRHASNKRIGHESKWRSVQTAKSLGTLFNKNKAKSEDGHVQYMGNGIPSSGTGVHQRASLPALVSGKNNDAYTDDIKAETSSHSESILDEARIDIGIHRDSTDAEDARLIKKNSIKTKWGKLKRRLSIEMDHIDSVSFDDNEILPDELEYIEGGEIVHAEVPPSPAYDASKHTLGPLVEENETKTPKDKSNNSAISLLRSRLTRTTSHENPLLSRNPATIETKM